MVPLLAIFHLFFSEADHHPEPWWFTRPKGKIPQVSDIMALRLKQCLESDWTSKLTAQKMCLGGSGIWDARDSFKRNSWWFASCHSHPLWRIGFNYIIWIPAKYFLSWLSWDTQVCVMSDLAGPFALAVTRWVGPFGISSMWTTFAIWIVTFFHWSLRNMTSRCGVFFW